MATDINSRLKELRALKGTDVVDEERIKRILGDKKVDEPQPITNPIEQRTQLGESFLNKHNIVPFQNRPQEEPLVQPKQVEKSTGLKHFFDMSDAGFVANLGRSVREEEPLINNTEEMKRFAMSPATLSATTKEQRQFLDATPKEQNKEINQWISQLKPEMNNLLDSISKKEIRGQKVTEEERAKVRDYETKLYNLERARATNNNFWLNMVQSGVNQFGGLVRGAPTEWVGINDPDPHGFTRGFPESESAKNVARIREENRKEAELRKQTKLNRNYVAQQQTRAIMDEAQKEGPVKQFFGEALSTSVNMVPSIAVSYFNPWIGASMLGAGALGNARLEALESGATDNEALIYSATIGLSETMLERLFLGSLSKLIPRGGTGSLINQATRNTVANLSILGKQMAKSSGLEALEEGLQVPVEKLARKFTFDETVTTADVLALEEILYNALLGAVVGTGFSAVPTAMNVKDMQKAKQYIDENGTNIFFTAYTLPRTYNSRATAENMMANPETITLENLMKLESEVTRDYAEYVKTKEFKDTVDVDITPVMAIENVRQEAPLRPVEPRIDQRKVRNTELKKVSGRIVDFGGPVKADTFSQFLFDEGYRVKELGYGQWELSKDGVSYSKEEMKKWDSKFKQFIRENMKTLEANFVQEPLQTENVESSIENNKIVYFQRINNFIADKIDKNVNTMVKRAGQSRNQMNAEQIQTFKQERYNDLSDRVLVIIDAIQNKDYDTLNNLVKVENDVEKTVFQEVTGLPVTSNKDIQEGINLLKNLSKPKAEKRVDKNIRQKIKEDKKNANVTSKAKVKPKNSNRVIDEKNVNEIFELAPQRQDTVQDTPSEKTPTELNDKEKILKNMSNKEKDNRIKMFSNYEFEQILNQAKKEYNKAMKLKITDSYTKEQRQIDSDIILEREIDKQINEWVYTSVLYDRKVKSGEMKPFETEPYKVKKTFKDDVIQAVKNKSDKIDTKVETKTDSDVLNELKNGRMTVTNAIKSLSFTKKLNEKDTKVLNNLRERLKIIDSKLEHWLKNDTFDGWESPKQVNPSKQIEPEVKPEPKEEIKSTDISTVKTGDKFVVNMYQGRGKTRKEIYNYLEKPILGEGSYFAFDEKTAKLYGDSVTQKEITLDNPLVIRDDADWDKITTKAGWEFRNPYGIDKEKAIKWIDDLEAVILKDGHDGVIIVFENDVRGDENYKTGTSIKSLRNVFSHDQVVVYPKADSKVNTEPKATDEILGVEKEEVKNELVETISEFDLSKSVRFKKQFVDISMNNGKTESIASETYNGLAVNKSLNGSGYSVTHIKSGISFKKFEHKEQAKVFARILADTFDVDVSLEEFSRNLLKDKEAKKYLDDLVNWVNDNINNLGKKKNNIIELERFLQAVKDGKLTPDDLINMIEVVGNDVSGFNLSMREQIMNELINGVQKDTISIDFQVEGDGYLEIKNAPDNIAQLLTALKLKLKPKGPPAFKGTSKAKSEAKTTETQTKTKSDVMKDTKTYRTKQSDIQKKADKVARERADEQITNNKLAEPISRSEIQELLQSLLDIPVGIGKFRERAWGIFKSKVQVIRLKYPKNLDTLFHETGHFFSEKLKLEKSSFSNELMLLGQNTSAPSYSAAKVQEEGVAEFFRLLLTDKQDAQRLAPNFYEYIESIKREEPLLKEVIDTIQTAVDNYIQQDPVSRFMSNISFKARKKYISFRDRLETSLTLGVDNIRAIERATSEISGGKYVPKSKDPFEVANLSKAWAGKAETFVKYGVVDMKGDKIYKGLNEIIEPFKGRLRELDAYLVAARVIYLHETRGIKTGTNITEARKTFQKFDSPEAQKVLKELQIYQDFVLQELVRSGILDSQQWKAIKGLNEIYVPLQRVVEKSRMRSNKGRAYEASNPVYGIKGGEQDIISPLESIIKNTYMFIYMAQKNNVGKALVELANQYEGSGKFVDKVPPKMVGKSFELKEIKKTLIQAGVPTALNEKGQVVFVDDIDLKTIATIWRPQKQSGNILTVFQNGKPQYYEIFDEPLYNAMTKSLEPTHINILTKILKFPTKLLRAGVLLDPVFMARNLARDPVEGFIYSENGFIPGVDTIKGIFEVFGKKDMYYKYLSSGASVKTIGALNRDFTQRELNNLFKSRFSLASLNPIRILENLTDLVEASNRTAIFSKGFKKRVADAIETQKNDPRSSVLADTIAEIALDSRRSVIDYLSVGDAVKVMSQFVPFVNPPIKSLEKFIRNFIPRKVNGKWNLKRAGAHHLRAAIALTLPTIILFLLNRDNEYYEELPQWRKDLFWNIPLNDKGGFIPVPKPWTVAAVPFSIIPERVMQWMFKEDPKAFDELGTRMLESITPPSIPILARPIFENISNYSFFLDQPIVPRSEQSLEPYAQFGLYTSEFAKALGKWTNTSPRKWDNAFRGYGGGLALYTLDMLDAGASLVGLTDEPPFPNDIREYRVSRGFFIDAVSTKAQTIEQFYNDLNELESKYATFRKFNKDKELNDFEQASELRRLRWIRQYLTDKRDQIYELKEKRVPYSEVNIEILKMLNVLKFEEDGRLLDQDVGYDDLAWEYKGKYISGEFKRENIKEDPKILSQLGFDASVLTGPRANLYKEIANIIKSDKYTTDEKIGLIKEIESGLNTLTESGIERILKKYSK